MAGEVACKKEDRLRKGDKEDNIEEKIGLLSLPPELITNFIILPWLSLAELGSLLISARSFREFIYSASLWRSLYQQEFGVTYERWAYDETWYSLFKARWLEKKQIVFTHGGNLLRSFCFPSSLVPSLKGGQVPTVVKSAAYEAEDLSSEEVLCRPTVYGDSVFIFARKGAEEMCRTLYHFELKSGKLLWKYTSEFAIHNRVHQAFVMPVEGKVFWLHFGFLGRAIEVLDGMNGDCIGWYEEVGSKPFSMISRSFAPLIVDDGRSIMIIDSDGGLLRLDCLPTNMKIDAPLNVIFRLHHGPVGEQPRQELADQGVSVCGNRAIWIWQNVIIVADWKAGEIVHSFDLTPIQEDLSGQGFGHCIFSEFAFDAKLEKAFALGMPNSINGELCCFAISLKDEETTETIEDEGDEKIPIMLWCKWFEGKGNNRPLSDIAPVMSNGLVFCSYYHKQDDSGIAVYAFDATNGDLRWTVAGRGGVNSIVSIQQMVVVGNILVRGLYIRSHDESVAQAIDITTGTELWEVVRKCDEDTYQIARMVPNESVLQILARVKNEKQGSYQMTFLSFTPHGFAPTSSEAGAVQLN